MSIRKVFDWLKNKGIAQKYNPYHHPAGSPMGGKFAPKSMASGGNLIHVPYRGTQVHQMLVRMGVAEPWKPKEVEKTKQRIELPEITGSEKQVKWAKDIRERFLSQDHIKKGVAAHEEEIKQLKALSPDAARLKFQHIEKQALNGLENWIRSQTDATFWIDQRDRLPGEIWTRSPEGPARDEELAFKQRNIVRGFGLMRIGHVTSAGNAKDHDYQYKSILKGLEGAQQYQAWLNDLRESPYADKALQKRVGIIR